MLCGVDRSAPCGTYRTGVRCYQPQAPFRSPRSAGHPPHQAMNVAVGQENSSTPTIRCNAQSHRDPCRALELLLCLFQRTCVAELLPMSERVGLDSGLDLAICQRGNTGIRKVI